MDNSFVDVSGATGGACSVAVGPGYVYWTGGSGTGYVGRASLSTRVPEDKFITTASDLPCGVAVDSAHVYWNNYSLPGIGRADLDGNNVVQNFIQSGVNPQHPSVDAGHVFWSNKGFNCSNPPPSGCTIGRADIDGNPFDQSYITGTDEPPAGTATDGTHVYWGNGFNTIGRANVDPPANPDPNFIPNVSACAVAVDGAHIYWADYGNTTDGGWIGRANLDGTDVREQFIHTAGGTCGVAVDGLSFTPPAKPPVTPAPPKPLDCAYGAPNCEAICTNPTTLLVACSNLTGSAGFCKAGDGLTAFGGAMPPQCLNPVTPRTQCSNSKTGRGTVCYQTTPGERPAAGSCASMGQALPECNVPNREVPTGCQGVLFTNYSFCSPTEQAVAATYCPASSATGVPACNFPTTVTPPSKPKGASASARRKTQLTVTIGCPKVLAKPRCKGTIAVDGLRTSLLRTLSQQARFSASTYRLFVPGLAGFGAPFEKTANAIAKRVLGGTKRPKPVKTSAVIAELGRSDPQTKSYAASLQRAVNEYRKLAGKAKKKRKRSKRADASRGTTILKRFSLKSGRKRARIRVRLSAAALKRLRRDAGNRSRAPIRVIVSFKATPRPVVRFEDLGLRVR